MKAEAENQPPDLTDFMNEWFLGSSHADRRQFNNLKGGGEGEKCRKQKETDGGERAAPPLSSSRLTQDWLEEAAKMVAAGTTSRHASPARSTGAPRFAAASQAKEPMPPAPPVDKRDALSRSARRNRSAEGISDEILQRSSARHNRKRSDFQFAADSSSAATAQHASYPFEQPDAELSPIGRLPPKLPPLSRSRFLVKTHGDFPRRSFSTPSLSSHPPSPHSPEYASHQQATLSPPRNALKSIHRRTASISTCPIDNDSTFRTSVSSARKLAVEAPREDGVKKINAFLHRQRAMISMASEGEVSIKAKIVLSSYSPDTSSMVAAICYSWLLENKRERKNSRINDEVVVPVINMRRATMWEHMQAAWLFDHIGIDASALIFTDELDLEGLLMGKQLSLVIVGQDVLQTNGEVGSLCTILTDNFCEDAYDLLQAPSIKRLLLAGILLDTQNLNCAAKSFTNRDAEAVQLLLVGSSPDYRDFFFKQVVKEHGEESFLESLRKHYGKRSPEVKRKTSAAPAVGRAATQPTVALPPPPFKATEKSSRVKNKFTLGRLFNF